MLKRNFYLQNERDNIEKSHNKADIGTVMSDESWEMKSAFVPRVTQLDANEFDKEIHNVLISQLMEISKYCKPGALNSIKHEINLILDLLVFYYSVIKKNATFGQELLQLQYKNVLSKYQLALYALINFILPYLNNKYEDNLNRIQSLSLKTLCGQLELFRKICNLINFIIFLREGEYPTIAERLLKLKYSFVNKLNPRVGYNYMTRELLWHGFMELLMHVLPLINYTAIKGRIRRLFLSKSSCIKSVKKIIYDCETKCVICDEFPNSPCVISKNCPHVACYYCIKSNLLADKKFMCPQCGEINTAAETITFFSDWGHTDGKSQKIKKEKRSVGYAMALQISSPLVGDCPGAEDLRRQWDEESWEEKNDLKKIAQFLEEMLKRISVKQ